MLLSNAGTGVLGPAEETAVHQPKRPFDVNFFGAVRVTDAALPLMRARKSGRVPFMSSAGRVTGAERGLLLRHQARPAGHAESLRHELRPLGIAVSVVAPDAGSTPAGNRLR